MNKMIRIMREGLTDKLVIGNATANAVAPGEVRYLPIHIDNNKFNLQSVLANSSSNLKFEVAIFESHVRLKSIYYSKEAEQRLIDVLNFPYVDQDSTNQVHLTVKNLGAVPADIDVELRGIKLR